MGLNSGVLLVRRSAQARQLLQFAWDQLSFNGSFNAEQNGLRLGLRRPYDAPSRSRAAAVSILEALVEYPFYHSALLARARKERNFTAPLYHAAGCSASRARVSSGFCDKILLKQVRRSDMGSGCPSIEEVYFTGCSQHHLQELGVTSMARRWLRGRDTRIKYADQKGSKKDGWWNAYAGCSEVGCDDPDAHVRANHKREKISAA